MTIFIRQLCALSPTPLSAHHHTHTYNSYSFAFGQASIIDFPHTPRPNPGTSYRQHPQLGSYTQTHQHVSTAHRAHTQPLCASEPLISPLGTMPPLTGSGLAETIPVAAPPAPTLGPIPALTFTDPPLPHATPAVAAPLILSPSLPPIPAKLVAKAQAGSFVAMKEFLADNVALTQRMDEFHSSPLLPTPWLSRASSARMRDISSASQWALCWMMYAGIQCRDARIRDMMAHGCIVLQLAHRHGGSGWLEYDRIFRQQAASDHSMPWNILNPSLMAATVLSTSTGVGMTCPHCQASDHRAEECALLSIDPYLEPHAVHRPPRSQQGLVYSRATPRSRYSPYPPPPQFPNPHSSDPCRRHNRGACPDSAATCRFRHVCSTPECLSPGHTVGSCPLRPTDLKGKRAPPPGSAASSKST